ncbi:hypothetical protein [Pontibacter roseus]|uniref:hypothetical protein n=1 Tax=Pontibacter roseus TaxID=336989 RepID=UPI00036A8A4D|nr:hypothetical protein [Pontibacter roseus]
MKMRKKRTRYGILAFLFAVWLTGCQTSTAPARTETSTRKSLAPQRVDIRGSIIRSQYNEGQVVLEVEAFGTSPDSRYNRAYVLVLPTAQMLDTEGNPISVSELRQGQHVAILLRGGGRGNFVGMGVARKLWLEEPSY